jgi:YHS domain-containing protein
MTVNGVCKYCKQKFVAKDRHKGSDKFCSRKCYLLFKKENRKEPNCECLQCGIKFRLKPSAIASGQGKFCSKLCYNKFQRHGIEIGKESYNDRHLLRQSSAYKTWRNQSKKRANYQCEKCGIKEGSTCECCGTKIYLHVHHIKPFASFIDLRFDPKNSMVLCPKCHLKE